MWVGIQHHALAALPTGERPGTHRIGGWVGSRAGLDGCGKFRPYRDSIPGLSSPYLVAIPTELSLAMYSTCTFTSLNTLFHSQYFQYHSINIP